MNDRYTIPKPEHGSAEWLAVRWADETLARRCPASVAAAMWDAHEFVTSGALAAEMLAEQPPEPGTPTAAMERGNDLEEALAQRWASREKCVVRTPKVLFCRGRAIATIDREVYTSTAARKALPDVHLEVKTTNKYIDPDAPLPDQWFWQGVAQSYCRGSRMVAWVVLDGHLAIHHIDQIITDEALAKFEERLTWWMTWIDNQLVPEGVTLAYEDHLVWHKQVDPEQVLVLAYESDDATLADRYRRDYIAAGEAIKQSEAERDQIKAWFADKLADREALYLADVLGFDPKAQKPIVTWKAGTRTAVNVQRLKDDDLYDKYAETTDTRTMLVKPIKET